MGCYLQNVHLGPPGIISPALILSPRLEPLKATGGSFFPQQSLLYSDRQFDLSLGFSIGPIWNKSGKVFERKLESAIAFIEPWEGHWNWSFN